MIAGGGAVSILALRRRPGGPPLMLSSAPPMPFSELIAQDRALGPLRSALRRGALHHAYLFGGPEGTGKGRAATLLAQAANCEGGVPGPGGLRDDPCGACPPCRKIAKGIHPDVLVLHEERVMAKAGAWEPKGGRTPSPRRVSYFRRLYVIRMPTVWPSGAYIVKTRAIGGAPDERDRPASSSS